VERRRRRFAPINKSISRVKPKQKSQHGLQHSAIDTGPITPMPSYYLLCTTLRCVQTFGTRVFGCRGSPIRSCACFSNPWQNPTVPMSAELSGALLSGFSLSLSSKRCSKWLDFRPLAIIRARPLLAVHHRDRSESCQIVVPSSGHVGCHAWAFLELELTAPLHGRLWNLTYGVSIATGGVYHHSGRNG
jgi:hypothetical protein